jgi:hypothetical protein
MMMKQRFFMLLLALASVVPFMALDVVRLQFNRTGTDAQSVAVTVTDGAGAAISGAIASFTASHALKGTAGAINADIVCPNVNANTSPNIELALTIEGLPQTFTFNNVGLDIHALNGGNNYQEPSDGVTRQWNVIATADGKVLGTLNDIDIAAGVGSQGAVHKVWNITSQEAVVADGTLVLKLAVTKGTTNNGCFFGLSEVTLSTDGTVTPEPEPEPGVTPDPDDSDATVYYITWKNTGGNYITEGSDHYLTVGGKNVSKAQFWKLIPTDKDNCYYVKNVVTGRYIGSCNMTPSSASRVTTSEEPVEYYVGPTSATSGETVGCHYFSSTDCAGYSDENAGPRALNKDGASSYVITWQAGTSRTGSYWKLVATTDEYEPPQHTSVAKAVGIYFNPCGTAGNNYLTSAKVHGEGVLDHIVYEASVKPASWHVPYPYDHGQVVRGATFDLTIALSDNPNADLKANAYFDWNADGEFEATTPIALNGKNGTATVAVPETASENPMRMRIRINSNGLDLAEDDVEGFVYDLHLTVVDPQEGRTVKLTTNGPERGRVTLSQEATSYAYGTTLTATATPKGDATFICWREEGVVVSTDAEYTFTVDRNVNLKAYFTANTVIGTGVETITLAATDEEVTINVEGDHIVARANEPIINITLYTADAVKVSQCSGNAMSTTGLKQGTYIVQATTPRGSKNVKLYLNK